MIIFTILLLILLILTAVIVFTISVGGATFIVLFGDVIVCGFLIIWVMKKLIGKK